MKTKSCPFTWASWQAYPAMTVPEIARLRITDDGDVFIGIGGHEMGQGIRTAVSAPGVPNLDEASFARMASEAEKNCPVSKVLNAAITLDARLI